MKTIPAFSIQNIKIVNNSTTTRTKIEEKNKTTLETKYILEAVKIIDAG